MSADVLPFPSDRALRRGEYEASSWGNCPKCRRAPQLLLNVHRDHFEVCEACRVYWLIGSNLLSSWRRESEADWSRNRATLAAMRRVEPLVLWPDGAA